MYQFRISHHNSPSTKFSLWIFHMVLPLAMISVLNISKSHKMKPCQWEFHHDSSGFVKKQMDSFVPFLHHYNHLQCHHLALQICMPSISARCSLQIRKSSDVSMPSQPALNVWILATAPSALSTIVTLICLGETTQFIEVRKPIHILHLPTTCNATSPDFHLPPHYEGPPLEVNISLDMVNLNMINISSINFCLWQHLEKHWNESQLQHLASIPSIPVGHLYSHMAKGIQHITPFSPDESTGDTDSIWTLFSHMGVYVRAIGSLIPAGLGVFCCYFFWC